MTELEFSFGDETLGWKLAQQLLIEVSDFIDSKYGFFFCPVCFKENTQNRWYFGALSQITIRRFSVHFV